jgi:hypothetical protein
MKTSLMQCVIIMSDWIGIHIDFGMGAACCAPTYHHDIRIHHTYIAVFVMDLGHTTS